jgi:hypothetical protein
MEAVQAGQAPVKKRNRHRLADRVVATDIFSYDFELPVRIEQMQPRS